jgi:hypothetical protein
MVAIASVVGAIVFGASLERLVDTPRLYGWTWDAMVFDPPEAGDRAAARIADDDNLSAVTAVGNETVTVEGRRVSAAGFQPLRGNILPTVSEGRWPAADDETALGSKTMRGIDVEIGDTVQAVGQDGGQRTLDVVGEILFPVVTPDVSSTADVGDGMALTAEGLGALAGDVRRSTYYVEFAPGGPGMAGLQADYESSAFGPQRPPDIDNYERVRPVPLALAVILGLLGAAMLTVGLTGTVYDRAHDLAVLRAVGFDRRQVRWTIAWQATTLALIALLLGVPAGVVLGRQAWNALAHRLAVPAEPSISLLTLLAAVVATLVLANAAAAIAGIRASRLPPAQLLRAE